MNLVFADTYSFFNILFDRYNIKMFEQGSNRMKKVFIGELFTMFSERYLLLVEVSLGKTVVKVLNMTGESRVCVFQKLYSTSSDKKALSKSTSLFHFLDKLLSCPIM